MEQMLRLCLYNTDKEFKNLPAGFEKFLGMIYWEEFHTRVSVVQMDFYKRMSVFSIDCASTMHNTSDSLNITAVVYFYLLYTLYNLKYILCFNYTGSMDQNECKLIGNQYFRSARFADLSP